MNKLVVINSFGPMASSLLAGLVEKFGYSNMPVRKLRLHQYLIGDYALNNPFMKEQIVRIVKKRSEAGQYGGISVKDRDGQLPRPLVDFARVENQVDDLMGYKAQSVADLYDRCRRFFADAMIYKEDKALPGHHIELTTDIVRFDPAVLAAAYEREFPGVKMLHLHRPFRGWINSTASQAFHMHKWKYRLKLYPHMRYADYCRYEDTLAQLPGLNIQFDELFTVPTPELARRIAEFVGEPLPQIDWVAEDYDMFGKLIPHAKAFTPFDDGQVYLLPQTLDLLEAEIQKPEPFKGLKKLVFWLLYLKDLFIYRYLRK